MAVFVSFALRPGLLVLLHVCWSVFLGPGQGAVACLLAASAVCRVCAVELRLQLDLA